MDEDNKPNGGFPPIVENNESEMKLVEQSKNREFAKISVGISIKDIMLKRNKDLTKNEI